MKELKYPGGFHCRECQQFRRAVLTINGDSAEWCCNKCGYRHSFVISFEGSLPIRREPKARQAVNVIASLLPARLRFSARCS